MAIKDSTASEPPERPEHAEHPWHDHDAVAAVFRALSEPARLQIVHSLSAGERRVRDLVAELGLAQSTTSAHLGTLRACGLVEARSQGRSSYYSLTTPALVTLVHNAEELLAHGLHVVVHEHAAQDAEGGADDDATPTPGGTSAVGPDGAQR